MNDIDDGTFGQHKLTNSNRISNLLLNETIYPFLSGFLEPFMKISIVGFGIVPRWGTRLPVPGFHYKKS